VDSGRAQVGHPSKLNNAKHRILDLHCTESLLSAFGATIDLVVFIGNPAADFWRFTLVTGDGKGSRRPQRQVPGFSPAP
jgi:hypothetical protein